MAGKNAGRLKKGKPEAPSAGAGGGADTYTVGRPAEAKRNGSPVHSRSELQENSLLI